VYSIVNIDTDRKYVGSTAKFSARKRQHLYNLRHHNHYSKMMQDDYNKYGEERFKFYILEEIETFDRKFLFEREQFWMDKHAPEYNNNVLAGDIFPSWIYTQEWKDATRKRMTGRKQSQEEKDARAASIKEFWKNHPAKTIPKEMREHLSKINTGEGNPNFGLKRSNATRQKQSNGLSYMEYSFIAPDGEIVTFCNLTNPKTDRSDIPPYVILRSIMRGCNPKPPYTNWKFVSKRKIK
jgi:group I intron endonuclease